MAQLDEPMRFGDREFPVGCPLRIGPLAPFGEGVELRPLVNFLTIFEGAGDAWSIRLRRPLVRLADSDVMLLYQTLEPVLSSDIDMSKYTRWYQDHQST